MKCEHCEFAPPVGPEGEQDECGCYEKYGTVWKDGSYGCTLNYQTLRKWDEEHMEDIGNMGEDMGIDMDFKNNGWDMEEAIRIMKHMIGMYPEGLRRTYKRYGTVFFKPYRNHWAGQNKYLDYFSGALGLCEKWTNDGFIPKNQPNYALTRRGLNFLGRHINVNIRNPE